VASNGATNLFHLATGNLTFPLLQQDLMRILFLGDLVGKPGYSAVVKQAESLRKELKIDALIVNAENASDGSGLMPRQFKRLIQVGVDAITLGDHIYKCREIIPTLNKDQRIVKPANYPPESPGRTWTVVETAGGPLGIVSLMGRVFMRPVDCPMAAADRVLAEIKQAHPKLRHLLVDVHAEATSDKQTIGRFLDGKVTAVIGTHTHVPTADACIFPGGTAFQCDAGMCGPYDSIIGRDIQRVTGTARTFEPIHFHVATRDVRICGVIVDTHKDGKAIAIERFERKIADAD
jgi:metallophosphoesterase (TIGR00282 family)